MSRGTGYGSTQRPYFDDPSREYRDEPSGRYQDSSYSSFDTICDQISSNIFTVNNGANSIDRAMKIIGTDKDSPKLRDKIHETSQDTNNVIAKTTKLIKQLASMSQANKQQKLKLERIKNDFQECIQRFSTLQKHMIGYSWQPVLMVEEETGKSLERTTDPREATGKLSHISTFAES